MGEVFGRVTTTILAGVVGVSLFAGSVMSQTLNDPPGRVGRLAFVDGTVSFHDDEENGWTKAVVNTPLTTGDALWTEPNARSEVSLAGTRIRMDGSTELDMTRIDDSRVRLQLAQGRLDVKTTQMDTSQPYEIVTPRGTIALQQQGDYYIEAGSQQDPTRLGVRSGAAQIQGLNGQTLAVRPGEVGEVYGDGSSMQLKTVRAAPPAPAASWAARDRQVVYEQPPQYIPAGMTGYEDLNAYGNWINDGSYGQVWVPRSTPAGWAPYRTGHWSYVKPWGWTWIDEQPWGFAPYHYGRWANSNNRWVWVPPQREERPVYAPALVAFVGGLELAAQLGNQGRNTGPVGWFPLGPREVYVPPYSTNRDYYQRINRAARIQDRVLEERWERVQRREAFIAGQNSVLANQRFATVVPSQAFVRSQPVQRAVLNVAADRLAKAAVAPVSAPPAPTASLAAVADAKNAAKPDAANAKAATDASARADVPVAKTAVADMDTLAKPKAAAAERKATAPGPKTASTEPRRATDNNASTADKPDANPTTPTLRPRQGAAPPALKETTEKDEPGQTRQERNARDRDRQDPGKPAANQTREAAPAPKKPDLASPEPSPAKRDDAREDRRQPDRDEPKQAAPDTRKPNAAQPRQERPEQAAPAPQRPAATPQPRQEERQAVPQPAPRQEAPRQEAPRQVAPQPRAEPPQPQRQEQAQPPRPQPQQQQPQQAQPPRQQQPQQQPQPQRERETRAPAPQQQQIAQPPQQQQQQQQPQPQRNNGGGGGGKKDKD